MMRRVLPVLLTSITLTLVVHAASRQTGTQSGVQAYRSRDFKRAAALLIPTAADAGFDEAMAVAAMYRDGLGVARNDASAYFFARRALYFDPRAPEAQSIVSEIGPTLSTAVRERADFWASRKKTRIDAAFACASWSGDLQVAHDVFSFRPGASIQQMAADIVYYSGLVQNFVVEQGNVPNASADIQGSQRRVLFNPAFLQQLHQVTGTPWGAYSVMAHEIGHHLQGHTIMPGGSRPGLELQADEFSGFITSRMGATLEQAQLAMSRLVQEQGSATHPGRSTRLAAIKTGWDRARSLQTSAPGGAPLPPIRTDPVPDPVVGPGPPPGPPPVQVPWPPIATQCVTPPGSCPMVVPIPVGSSCYCVTASGPVPGTAR
jgi:hypothetical protein